VSAVVQVPEGQAQEVRERPYPGLRPFLETESHLFFGREPQRDACIRRLQETRFLAVVGTSGAGKSSLVRAGIVPALKTGLLRGSNHHWQAISIRPGATPTASLAQGLLALARDNPDVTAKTVEAALRRSLSSLTDVVASLNGNRGNVLLVIDQFEELFRLGAELQAPDAWLVERQSFIQRLLRPRLQSEIPLFIAITMRTDFIEDCARFRELPEALNESQFLVPRLTRPQLERAIASPAVVVGHPLNHSLIKRVLNDAMDLPDELPVVQHALMRTWLCWEAKRTEAEPPAAMGVSDYEAIGTVTDALNRHGQELHDSLTADGRLALKLLIQRITIRDAAKKVTRSPAPLQTIRQVINATSTAAGEQLDAVLAKLRDDSCRFLMPATDAGDPELQDVDITHEAVLRVWAQAVEWIRQEYEDAQSYRIIAEYERLERLESGQLLSGRLLATSQEWWSKRKPSAEWARRYQVVDSELEQVPPPTHAAQAEVSPPVVSMSPEEERARHQMAWSQQAHARVDKYLKRSARARALSVAYRLAALAGLVAIALLVLHAQKRDREILRDKALGKNLDAIRNAQTDAEASKAWCQLNQAEREQLDARKVVDTYWKTRIDNVLSLARDRETSCPEEALLLYAHAVERAGPKGDTIDRAKQVAETLQHVTTTVWLPATTSASTQPSACSLSTETCRQLRFDEQGALFGLCSGKLYRWKSNDFAKPDSVRVGAQTMLELAGDFVVTSDGKRVHVRRGMEATARSFGVHDCKNIGDIAASFASGHLRIALACYGDRDGEGTVAKRLDVASPSDWLATLSDARQLSLATVSLAQIHVNSVGWMEQRLVVGTESGLWVEGGWVGERGLQIMTLAAPVGAEGRIAYGTAQDSSKAARIGVIAKDKSNQLRDFGSWMTLQPGQFWIDQVSAWGNATAALAQSDPPRSRLSVPGLEGQLTLETVATAVATAALSGKQTTVVALPGRLRFIASEKSQSLDWQRAQNITALTVLGDEAVVRVQRGGATSLRSRKQVFPSVFEQECVAQPVEGQPNAVQR
jgi:hypothetical protein